MQKTVAADGQVKSWARRVAFVSLAMSAMAARSAEADLETLVYLPFDSDLKSKVYVDRNGTVLEHVADGTGAISFKKPECRYVYDGGLGIQGRQENAGYLSLKDARVNIPLEGFALSNDVDAITVEMFVRANEGDMAAWQEWIWISPIVGEPAASQMAARSAALFYSQVQSASELGKANYEVRNDSKEWHRLLNGNWHHIALTICPNASGGSTISYCTDYGSIASYQQTERWTGSAGTSGMTLYLSLGGRNMAGSMDVDELRITRGVVPKEKYLHLLSQGRPSDGDVLCHFPLDGDMLPMGYREQVPRNPVTGFTAGYDAAGVLGGRVCRYFSWDACVRETNVSCLRSDKTGRSSVNLVNPWLYDGSCDSMTVEFFLKGTTNAADIATWQEKFMLNSTDGYLLLVQGGSNKKIYLRADRIGGSSASYSSTYKASLTDGKWHHVAMTVQPEADGTSDMITYFIDYQKVFNQKGNAKWCGFGKADKILSFGTKVDAMSLDEVRITKGVLPVEMFLRQTVAQKPAEGEAVLHLPLDADLNTITHPGDNLATVPTNTSFTAAAAPKRLVTEYGDAEVLVRPENLGCLYSNKTVHRLNLGCEWLTNGLESATIEFFMKGSSASGNIATWGEKLRLASSSSKDMFAFLVQANGSKKYFFRFDSDTTGYDVTPNVYMTDGKWHHFAVTIEPTSGGNSSVAKVYVDYGDPVSKTLNEKWRGIRPTDYLTLGTTTDVLWFDEVRISKGVLPKDKFMKQRNGLGLVILMR